MYTSPSLKFEYIPSTNKLTKYKFEITFNYMKQGAMLTACHGSGKISGDII